MQKRTKDESRGGIAEENMAGLTYYVIISWQARGSVLSRSIFSSRCPAAFETSTSRPVPPFHLDIFAKLQLVAQPRFDGERKR